MNKRCFLIPFAVLIFNCVNAQFPQMNVPVGASNITPHIITGESTVRGIRQGNGYPVQPPGYSYDYEADIRAVNNMGRTQRNQMRETAGYGYGSDYDLPFNGYKRGTQLYYDALGKLMAMINDSSIRSIKDAVFIVENCYHELRLDKAEYEKGIKRLVDIARQKSAESKYKWNKSITKKMMLFRAMADTLSVKGTKETGGFTSYPMAFDFNDPAGDNDWSNMFVTKLLTTNTGQCHSLSLLYTILCESVNEDAYTAYSPSHVYVKVKDDNQNWINLELTNGNIVSDAYIVGSGFITAEAIKNKIYMKPNNKREIIASCICDLAVGYIKKYGYDRFVRECADISLEYSPYNMSALAIKANYQTVRFEYAVNMVGRPEINILKKVFPKVYKLREERDSIYNLLDASGFRNMPGDIYKDWIRNTNP